ANRSGPRPGRTNQSNGGEQRRQHDFHFVESEGHPEAHPVPAAEWKPFVTGILPLEKPLRPELLRLRIQVRPAVHQVIARRQQNSGGIFATADGVWRLSLPNNKWQDCADAQRFADRCVEIIQLTQLLDSRQIAPADSAQLVADALHGVSVRDDLFERPAERECRRFMTGDEHGDDGIANFLVAQRLAIFMSRGEQIYYHAVASRRGLLA